MLKKKKLVAAIAATGLSMAAGSGMASETAISHICGQTLDDDVVVNCIFALDTFTEDCKINLDTGVNLTISQHCLVDAAGYSLEIYGAEDATLTFGAYGNLSLSNASKINFGLDAPLPFDASSNAFISNASKINFDLDGHSGSCESDTAVISVDGYDFESNGAGKRQSRITMNVKCGDIDVDFMYFAGFDADRMIWLKTVNGNIDISGAGDNFLMSGEDGAIKISAGREGKATIGDYVDLSAGAISIVSKGGSSEVSGNPPPPEQD